MEEKSMTGRKLIFDHKAKTLSGTLGISAERKKELEVWYAQYVRPVEKISIGLELIRQAPAYTEAERIYLYYQRGVQKGHSDGAHDCVISINEALPEIAGGLEKHV